MNRYLFGGLCFIEKYGKKKYKIREISDSVKFSRTIVSKCLKK